MTSELGQLGVGTQDAFLDRPEVDENSDPLLDSDDTAEAVLIVTDPVADAELPDGLFSGGLERAGRQMAARYC
ncbi:hypothetical protein J7E94_32010 [Streptomyces sp. ISL-94]|nr:hypothetical protein [Streptomyces sp. ISL-94]